MQNISASFSELFPNYVPPSPFASKSGGGHGGSRELPENTGDLATLYSSKPPTSPYRHQSLLAGWPQVCSSIF